MRVNKLIEELSTVVLAEFDSEVRFKTLALKGNKQAGLDLLGKLDSSFMKASRQDSQLPNSPLTNHHKPKTCPLFLTIFVYLSSIPLIL